MTSAPNTAPPRIFSPARLRAQRDRSAARFSEFDFLKRRVSSELVERLDDVAREFPNVMDIGAHDGSLSAFLAARPGVRKVLALEPSPAMAAIAGASEGVEARVSLLETLDVPPASFDLAVSALALHWVNDLPGLLVQVRQALKPDGLFLAALFGGETLKELRQSLMQAESELLGGAGARVSPFLDGIDGGRLLQRAGFALPVADSDRLTVTYETLFHLIAELRGMGEASKLAGRVHPLRRDVLMRAAEIHAERFSDPRGRITATFDIVWLAGWAPAPDQPRPKRPGSATHSLAEAVGAKEIPAGEKTGARGSGEDRDQDG